MEANVGVEGYFKIRIYDAKGDLKEETAFRNMITNGGLHALGSRNDYLNICYIGSGTTPANVDQTSLTNQVASSSSLSSFTSGTLAAVPFYGWVNKVFSFSAGTVIGSISELGVGWASNGLFNRALILDIYGQPTTLTVLSEDSIEVEYEFRYYPKITDDTGTTVFTGDIGGTYNWTFRSAKVGTDANWYVDNSSTSLVNHGSPISTAYVTENPIDIYTSQPSTTGASTVTPVARGYGDNLQRIFDISLTTGIANFATGIKSIYFSRLGFGAYQIEFTPSIPKTSLDQCNIAVKVTWDRI